MFVEARRVRTVPPSFGNVWSICSGIAASDPFARGSQAHERGPFVDVLARPSRGSEQRALREILGARAM